MDVQQRREDLAARMQDPRTVGGILDNGMSWFLRKNHRPENKVFVCLVVKTGSAYEEEGNYGIAHYIEHMLFNGTASYEGEALIEELQRLGVGFGHDLNAYTSLDHTVYHLEIERSPENVAKALHILSEFAFDARLEAAHIEKERPIILEEKRLRSGRGEKYIRLLLETVFGGTPYQRLVIGTDEDIKSVQKADFDAFYQRWYSPQHMAVLVVGDIDIAATQAEIQRLFDRDRAPQAPTPSALDTISDFAPKGAYRLFTHEETATGNLQFFTTRRGLRGKVAAEDHRDWMQYVIGEVLAERYQTYITDNDTCISQTQCDYMGEYTRMHDLFSLGCVFDPEHLHEAASLLATEMERMRRYGPTQEEVRRICANLRQRLEQRIIEEDTTSHWTYVQKIMSGFLLEDELGTPVQDLHLLKEYEATTSLETLAEVARDLLAPEHLVCIIEMPKSLASEALPGQVETIMHQVGGGDILPFTADTQAGEVERFMETREALPTEKLPAPLEMTRITLPCGAPCYIKETTFQKDRFMIRVLFEGGDIYLPREQQGMTEFLLKYMADSGTKHRSASTINKLLQEKSISLQLDEDNPSSIVLYGSCKTADAALLMELAHDVLFEPTWKNVGWNHAQQFMALTLQEARANPQAAMQEQHSSTLLQDHPSSFMPRIDDVSRWTPEQVQAYYSQIIHGNNMHVTIVSSMSTDMATGLVTRFLSEVPVGIKPPFDNLKTTVPFPQESGRFLLEGANEEKASVLCSMPGVSFLHPQRHLYTLAAEVLSDRLRKTIRERMGNTYSIYASHNAYRCLQGGDFSIRFGTGPEDVEGTLARLLEELEIYRTGDITQDEVDRALAPRRTQFQAQQKENNFWLQCLVDPWNKVPETYIFAMYERLQRTTAKELTQFLHEVFCTEPKIISILLPKR